jgi:hypothetical protein
MTGQKACDVQRLKKCFFFSYKNSSPGPYKEFKTGILLLRYGVSINDEIMGTQHLKLKMNVFCSKTCNETLDQRHLFGENHNGSTNLRLCLLILNLLKKSKKTFSKKWKISYFSLIFFFL